MDVFPTQDAAFCPGSPLSRVLQTWLFPLGLMFPAHFLPFLLTERIGTLDRVLSASWQSPQKADALFLTSPLNLSQFSERSPPRASCCRELAPFSQAFLPSPLTSFSPWSRQLSHAEFASMNTLSFLPSFLSIGPTKVLHRTFTQRPSENKRLDKRNPVNVRFNSKFAVLLGHFDGHLISLVNSQIAWSDSFSFSWLDRLSLHLHYWPSSFSSRICPQPVCVLLQLNVPLC